LWKTGSCSPSYSKGVDGSDKTASLNDLAPNTFGEKVASYFSISQRLEIAAVEQALDNHHTDLLQERDMLQQFAQGTSEATDTYRERLQTLNSVIPQSQFTTQQVAEIESFVAQQTGVGLGTPFQEMTGSAMNSNGISNISNAAQHSAQGIDPAVAHQQQSAEDHLEQARQKLDQVSADSVAANETGMGAGMAADTAATGSEALAALL
jgi:hypothetical protein